MSAPKLEKSVNFPASKKQMALESYACALTVFFVLSLLTNVFITWKYSNEADSRQLWAKDYYAERDKNRDLREQLHLNRSRYYTEEMPSDEPIAEPTAPSSFTAEQPTNNIEICFYPQKSALLSAQTPGLVNWKFNGRDTDSIICVNVDDKWWLLP